MAQQIIIPASSTQTKLDILNGTQSVSPTITFPPSATDVTLSAILTSVPAPTTFTLFGTADVSLPKLNDGEPLELGLKFKASQAGSIKGIRFYKPVGTTGTHTASLWLNSTTKLASAQFTAETASGWQEATFPSPVSVTASTAYTASVFFASGDYISRVSGLSSIVTQGPISTIAGTNGVFKYGPTGFPAASYQDSNYYVDVIFSTDGVIAPTTTSTTSTTSTSSTSSTTSTSTTTKTPTTPPLSGEIQGYGADVTGGSGKPVVHITSLSQLAGAIGSNKTILIDVSGTITGRFDVTNVSNLTIDAYSTKQDVTVNNNNNGDGMSLDGCSNVLIRGLRFINAGNDGMNILGSSNNVVFDHCSAYNNADGSIDIAAVNSGGKNFTVQWCMMGKNNGSGNMLITTQNASVHHNLFYGGGTSEGSERNPFAHSNYSPKGSQSSPNFDFRNNLVATTGRYASGNGYGAVGNYVNNYYTSTKSGMINLCADSVSCGTAYVSGNFNQASATGGTSTGTQYTIPTKYQITTMDAKTAARAILQSVGPYQRNAYEQSIINSITIAP